MNTIAVTGNLVDDPEVKEYQDGKHLANFRIANNEQRGEERILNGFFDVTVFGPQARHVGAGLKKGERVTVLGRLDHRTFEREDGSTGSRTKIVAMAVGLSLEYEAAARVATKEPTEEAPAAL